MKDSNLIKPPPHKLDILIVWRAIPTPYDATTIRIFHLLKYSKKHGHSITLVSHDGIEKSGKYKNELQKYCHRIEIINMPKNVYMHTLKDALLSPELVRDRIVPTCFYSKKMRKRIREVLLQKKFDIIYCDRPMLPYVLNTNLPKVLDLVEPVLYSRYQVYLNETRVLKKIWWLPSKTVW